MSFGALIGWLAGSVLRIRRRHVEQAMTRAGVADARTVATAMYRQLGVGLVELLRGASPRDVTIDEAAFDREGPLVIFASHTGNWELAAAAAARTLRPRRLHVIAKPMHSAFIERMLAKRRARLGVHVIRPEGALATVTAALARGDVVAMPIDQVPESHGLWTPFLGARALVDRAPAAVAWRARATALVVANGKVIDVIPPPAETDGREWIDRAALRATAALERFIRVEPALWMWLHRRWRPALTQANSRA